MDQDKEVKTIEAESEIELNDKINKFLTIEGDQIDRIKNIEIIENKVLTAKITYLKVKK